MFFKEISIKKALQLSLKGFILIFAFTCFIFNFPSFSVAEDTRLFNRRALSKAVESKNSLVKKRNTKSRSLYSTALSSNLSEELRLDTVDEILMSSRKQDQLFSEYRNIAYLTYVSDFFDVDPFETLDSKSLAEQMFVFGILKEASFYIKRSPLAKHVKRTIKKLKKVRDYSSLNISNTGVGKIKLGGHSSHGKKLLEFKFHASARDGLEPRVTFSDSVTFRYNWLQGISMFEYKYNF